MTHGRGHGKPVHALKVYPFPLPADGAAGTVASLEAERTARAWRDLSACARGYLLAVGSILQRGGLQREASDFALRELDHAARASREADACGEARR